MRSEDINAYEVIENRRIEELRSDGVLLRHKKTGARVVCLSNDDENKVFHIGFRTPPKDSTGVAHIIEHSVLCGSRDFPVKDPFVEMEKGSLKTFLNAITYPDMTVYPVASCNDIDFQNLMHVYLDAVLYPNIYKNEKIFRQEGWHYELEDPEDELKINGVVYNEMKGAMSNPEDVLFRENTASLYPDTAYAWNSGGDPKVIPELTYEDFLDFHRKYYHPSNAYIYLYGNMDMVEKLNYIDKEYLSAFEKNEAAAADSRIEEQKAFTQLIRVVREYPISDSEDEGTSAYLSLNMSVGDILDRELYMAMQVLDYALCSAPGAPLKKALVEKNIGKDVYSEYYNSGRQPYFSIIAKDTGVDREQEFLDTITEVLTGLVKNGLDRKALLAGISHYEFHYREADYGSTPKGLMYGLQIMDSWLYDESKPFIHVEVNETFAQLRSRIEDGYFEELIRTYLLENAHRSVVVLKPRKGLAEERERMLREELRQRKAQLSPASIDAITVETRELKAFQESEDAPEDLAKIPMLSREDIGKAARKLLNEERTIGETKVLYHPIFTNGVGYLRMIFTVKDIPEELFGYIGLLKGCLGLLNTRNYQYGDLFNEINILTGGMSAIANNYADIGDLDNCHMTLELKTKALYENMEKAVELMEEIIMTSDFTDEKRLREILAEGISRMQSQMTTAGHSVAVERAFSYGSVSGAVGQILGGVDFYRLCAKLEAHFEDNKRELVEKLTKLAQLIFRRENLMVDFVGTEEGYEKLPAAIERFCSALYTCPVERSSYVPAVSRKNEGFMTSGQVQYVCRAGNFKTKGLPYTGVLKALRVMLEFDYLWTNVRVKNGAYGCMCGFGRSGESYFVSYRDPNLKKTIDIYERAAQAVASFDADERTVTQFVIGAVSELDKPLTPASYGLLSLGAYMTGVTQEMLDRERAELLSTTKEDIRGLSKYIESFLSDEYLCVVGSAERIREAEDVFEHTEHLF